MAGPFVFSYEDTAAFCGYGWRMNLQDIKDVLSVIISLISICVSCYACYKFLSKPHDTLDIRVSNLEKDVGDIKQSLKEGNDKFRVQDKLNATFKAVNLAFIDFEIAYCQATGYKDTADLKKAKRIMQKCLAGYDDYEEDTDD